MSTSMFAAIYLIGLGYMIDQLLSYDLIRLTVIFVFVFVQLKRSTNILQF